MSKEGTVRRKIAGGMQSGREWDGGHAAVDVLPTFLYTY